MNEQIRAEFEQWANGRAHLDSFEIDGEKRYAALTATIMWESWQAANARYAGSGEAVGKAYVDLHGNITVSWFGEIKNGSLLYDCQLAQPKVPNGMRLVPDYQNVDEIVTAIYRRFKDWSNRGFTADDVTWCEVKADILAMIAAQPKVPEDVIRDLLNAIEGIRSIQPSGHSRPEYTISSARKEMDAWRHLRDTTAKVEALLSAQENNK